MRHIIVHLIRGEAGKAHENITKDLTKKFDSFPLHNRIQPHLTLKRWFELDNEGMDVLYKKLDDFVNSHHQTNYSLKGFGNFGSDVIYVDVVASQELLSDLRDLNNELHTIQGLTFDEFDAIENDLHATVAMGALKPFDYEEIWNYLNAGPIPHFDMKFDNIAVMKRDADRWVIDRVWEIK